MSILLNIVQPSPFWTWVGIVCGIAAVLGGVFATMLKVLHSTVGPTFRLRQRITKWLVRRHWALHSENSPSLYFGLWARNRDNPNREMLICRDKNDKGLLAFTAAVPLSSDWLEPLNQMPQRRRDLLVEELGIFVNTMAMGFEGVEWPLNNLVVQTALPIDRNLSEHSVDLQAKQVAHAVTAARRIIRKAVIQSTPDATS